MRWLYFQDQQEIIERLREDLRSKEEGLNEYEKRMADLVAEKEKIVKDVHVIEKQISSLVEAKRESDDDLKETRTQVREKWILILSFWNGKACDTSVIFQVTLEETTKKFFGVFNSICRLYTVAPHCPI